MAREYTALAAAVTVLVLVVYFIINKTGKDAAAALKEILPSGEKFIEAGETLAAAKPGDYLNIFRRRQNEEAYVSQEAARARDKATLAAMKSGRRVIR